MSQKVRTRENISISILQLQNFVFVSRNATVFNRDNQKKLHSVFGKAIEFGGKLKYGLYFIHGVPISKNLFYKLCNKLYTFQDWVKEKNEEVKSAILSFFEEGLKYFILLTLLS